MELICEKMYINLNQNVCFDKRQNKYDVMEQKAQVKGSCLDFVDMAGQLSCAALGSPHSVHTGGDGCR